MCSCVTYLSCPSPVLLCATILHACAPVTTSRAPQTLSQNAQGRLPQRAILFHVEPEQLRRRYVARVVAWFGPLGTNIAMNGDQYCDEHHHLRDGVRSVSDTSVRSVHTLVPGVCV